MGYDAYVRCNCYQEGKLKSRPPYEEHVTEDEEGLWLELPWETNQDENNAFDAWKDSNPCGHEDMEVCSERLANIWGMASFRTLIANLGPDKYPVLSEYLPTANGGFLPAEQIPGLQKELARLQSESPDEDLVVLREISTDTRVQSTNANDRFTFIFTAGNLLHYVLAREGLLILDHENGDELVFSASRFTQSRLENGNYLLGDVDSNKIFISKTGLSHDLNDRAEELRFAVEWIKASVNEEYAYIIEPLERLAAASLETGNPICWC